MTCAHGIAALHNQPHVVHHPSVSVCGWRQQFHATDPSPMTCGSKVPLSWHDGASAPGVTAHSPGHIGV